MNNEIAQEQEQEQEREIARQLEMEKRETVLRRLREEAKEAKDGVGKIEETQGAIKRLRNIYYIINGTVSITGVGLIAVFLGLLARLILGNLLGIKVFLPLNSIEILFLIIVSTIIALVSLIAIVIIYFIINPCELSVFVGTWWADLFGVVCEGAEKVLEAVK